jgi:hypothetical protein
MKAFKEKRIRFRSLLRGGLVILSLMALAFASCGDSGSDDDGVPYAPVKAITSISVLQYPSEIGGTVYEGLNIDLTGIRVIVRYVDGDVAYVTDPRKLVIIPPIYDGTFLTPYGGAGSRTWSTDQDYRLSYHENGQIFSAVLEGTQMNANIKLLENIHVTGELTKQNYLVDETPDFKGIMVEGVYTESTGNYGPGQQQDTIHKTLLLNPAYTEWAWIHNLDSGALDTSGSDSGFVNDNPGILIRVGSFGNLRADGAATTNNVLTGKRIPVGKLHQVEKVEFVTPPSFSTPIYVDDPSLMSGTDDTTATASYIKWQRTILGDGRIKVSYKGTDRVREWTIADMNTLDNKSNMDPNLGTGNSRVWDVPELVWKVGTTEIRRDYSTDDGMDGTSTNWHDWGTNKAPRIFVEYRGMYDSVTVPVFNKLQSITATSRTGNLVVLNAADKVYSTADTASSFFRYHKVSATYTQNLDSAITSTRDDVEADIDAGTCRHAQPTGANPPPTCGLTNNLSTPTNLLNTANSDNFAKGKETKVTVTFTPGSASTALGSKKTTVNIGMIGY